MNRNDFVKCLEQPASILEFKPTDFKNILDEYPYFQAAHLMYAFNLFGSNDLLYHDKLKISAAHIADRSVLYWLIHPPAAPAVQNPVVQNEDTAPAEIFQESVSLEAQPIAPVATPDLPADNVQLPEEDQQQAGESDKTENIAALSASETISDIKYSYREPAQGLLKLMNKALEKKTPPPEDEKEKAGHEAPAAEEKKMKDELIDLFIKNEPSISPARRDFFNPQNMAVNSSIDKEDIVTETLANIYVSQGLYQKALKIYQKLYLVFPEKRTYFAAQIENLESKINKNQ